ncbi:MAG: AMIN domain-containing protein [Aphanocapsa sp. GSE-SYN-MK-11-07L]|nr:AMIN domain-containing protein [Aphanocapsa sp. GSE-SYN-MK-11-07L]
MNCSQLVKLLTFSCALWCPVVQPVLANEVEENTNDAQTKVQTKFSTRAADLLVQEPSAAIQVTAVRLNRTETELQIVLETAGGETLQIDASKFTTEGNALIADIPNALLVERVINYAT